jgi:poly(A) polymerase Pap1
MKLNTVLGIIGAVLVIAGIAYFVIRKQTQNNSGDEKENRRYTDYPSQMKSEESFEDVKNEAVSKMKERHDEAQQIMKDSVDNIFGEKEVGETKNEEAKKKIFSDLDNI